MHPNVHGIIQRGLALLSAGNLDDADAQFKKALRIYPDHGDALHALGVVALHKHDFPSAVEYLTRAGKKKPTDFRIFTNLSVAQLRLGSMEAAFASASRAIALKADCAEAYLNRGYLHLCYNRPHDALKDFDSALKIKQNYEDAHLNRGIALHKLGRFADALAAYGEALSINPRRAETYDNLGQSLASLDRLEDALFNYNKAIELQPANFVAYYNRGNALQDLGRLPDALDSYDMAIKLNPGFAEAYSNRANALQGLRRLNEALASSDRAIGLNPHFSEVHSNRANILRELGRLEEALNSCNRAIELDPAFAPAYSNRGDVLSELGQAQLSEESYRSALAINPQLTHTLSNLIFNLNYAEQSTALSIKSEAERFGRVASALRRRRYDEWSGQISPSRLKVGFVSGDLRNHPVGYFTEELFRNLANSRLDLFAYSNSGAEDELTKRIKPFFREWKQINGCSDNKASAQIHSDSLHLLVDLSGHTGANRLPLFAYRPAPIQISWLGYCGTTGVEEIDYVLGDSVVIPESEESHFCEAVWRLPETYWCFSEPREKVETRPPPALENHAITFGCFNNLRKVNDRVISVWADILKAVPESRLFLKSGQLEALTIANALRQSFLERGVSAERLILEGRSSREEYLKAYNRVDIALDTFPYPGGATSLESLWMGVPVLTMKGNRFYSHNGEAIARHAGLSSWIAADDREYLQKAVERSSALGQLASLRQVLRKQVLNSPLFDAERFSMHFEQALWEMWRCRRQEHFQP